MYIVIMLFNIISVNRLIGIDIQESSYLKNSKVWRRNVVKYNVNLGWEKNNYYNKSQWYSLVSVNAKNIIANEKCF